MLGDYLYTAWGSNGQWGYNDALKGIKNTPVTQMKEYTGTEMPIGSILCVWCDEPNQTYDTKTERTGWGWWAKTVTYREFTYQVEAAATTDYTICAVNDHGVSSDPITATLTVRPSVRDWWHGIFDKWF